MTLFLAWLISFLFRDFVASVRNSKKNNICSVLRKSVSWIPYKQWKASFHLALSCLISRLSSRLPSPLRPFISPLYVLWSRPPQVGRGNSPGQSPGVEDLTRAALISTPHSMVFLEDFFCFDISHWPLPTHGSIVNNPFLFSSEHCGWLKLQMKGSSPRIWQF